MFQNIFIIWLGVLPLIVFRGHYEAPKVLILLIGGFFLTLFWIFKVIKSKKKIVLEKSDKWFLIWILTLAISGLFQNNSFATVVQESYRKQGVIFFLTIFLVGFTARILSSKKKLLLTKVITVTIILETLIVIYQVATNNLYFGKPLGTIGEPNAIAGFMAIAPYITSQILPKINSLFVFLPIALTASRAGIISIFPFVLGYFYKKVKPVFLFIVAFILILFVVFVSGNKANSQFENRFLFWRMGIEAAIEKPIIGYGPESQTTIYREAFEKAEMPLLNLMIDRSHNLFLDVVLWSGILGLVPFCLWLINEFKRNKESFKRLAMISFLIFAFFQPLSVVHWVMIMIIFNL